MFTEDLPTELKRSVRFTGFLSRVDLRLPTKVFYAIEDLKHLVSINPRALSSVALATMVFMNAEFGNLVINRYPGLTPELSSVIFAIRGACVAF